MTEPLGRRRRSWLLPALAAVPIVLLGAVAGVWLHVTGRILDGLPAFIAAARQEGWEIETGRVRRGSRMGAATVHVADVIATRRLGGTALRWTVPSIDLSIAPTMPDRLQIAPYGAGTLQFGDEPPRPLTAREATVSVPLDGRGPSTLRVADLAYGTERGGVRVGGADIEVGLGTVAVSARAVMVAPAFAPPFEHGASITARLVATPPIPFAATPGESARAWQAQSGRGELTEFALDWGALRVEGTGSGGLDSALQPVLEARVQVQGALEVLDAAARAGAVAAGPAAAARAVLGLLAMAAKGGPITLPVLLRDRTLTVAQFPLWRLPPLAWDAP